MEANSEDRLVLSSGEVDLLFGMQAAEIQAKVALADFVIQAERERKRLTEIAEEAASARLSAFEGILRARGFSNSTHKIEIDRGEIVPIESSLSTVTITDDMPQPQKHDWARERGSAVSCRMKGEEG